MTQHELTATDRAVISLLIGGINAWAQAICLSGRPVTFEEDLTAADLVKAENAFHRALRTGSYIAAT